MTFQRVLIRLFRTLANITLWVASYCLIKYQIFWLLKSPRCNIRSVLSSVLLSKFNPSLVNFISNKEKFQIKVRAVLGDGWRWEREREMWREMLLCWCDWIMTGLVTYLSLVSAIHWLMLTNYYQLYLTITTTSTTTSTITTTTSTTTDIISDMLVNFILLDWVWQ